MGSRQRRQFTPQDSPPQASSSNGGDLHDRQEVERELGEPSFQGRGTAPRMPATTTPPALQAWTAHQSHAQATILFYVPRGTHTEDLAVTIGHDYVIAGVRGRDAIVKARLAGRIDPQTSRWQLERKRSSKRHRSQSQTGKDRQRRSGPASSQSGESSSSSSGGAKSKSDSPSASHQGASTSAMRVETGQPSTLNKSPVTPQQQTFSSMTAMPTTSQAGQAPGDLGKPSTSEHEASHSFDLLSKSVDTLGSHSSDEQPSPPSRSSSHDSQQVHSSSRHPATPPSLAQSMTLSEESGYVRSTSAGVRSLDSSVSAAEDTSRGADSNSGRSRNENDDELDATADARLVTLHLDKIDAGIWPCLVSGAAPIARNQPSTALPHLISQKSETSLSAALSEALNARESRATRGQATHSRSPSASSASETGTEERHADASTLTVDTQGSDDSTTILGVRTSNEEDQFNMDPISLTLMGLQCARRSTGAPASLSSAREGSLAFEYFRRAWRQGEIAIATQRLVEDYLPLPRPQSKSPREEGAPLRNIFDTLRPRLVAALGGPTALARLYLSYARIDLPSSAHRRPLLSLPITGQSTNPFGSYAPHKYTHYPTSPRSPGSNEEGGEVEHAHSPLEYFEEARRLDPTVSSSVTDTEWREAGEVHEVYVAAQKAFSRRGQRGARSPSSRSEGTSDYDSGSNYGLYGSRYDDSTSLKHLRREHRKRRKRGKADVGTGTGTSAADQGLVFLVVSRAALLSVVVAGGMAVAGWWRRAAASAGGG